MLCVCAVDLLFVREGFKIWWVHPNAARAPNSRMHPSIRALPYSKTVWEAGPPPLAWEIALVRDRAVPAAPLACPKRVHYAPKISRAHYEAAPP